MYTEYKFTDCKLCKRNVRQIVKYEIGTPSMLLVFNHDQGEYKPTRPDILNLVLGSEKYKYRLIGVARKVGSNHFIAEINLEDNGWYSVDDLGKKSPQKILSITPTDADQLIFYERIQ